MTLLERYERQAAILRPTRELPLGIRENLARAGVARFLGVPQPVGYDNYANFAYSTVATAPSPATSGTSLVVHSGDGSEFPSAPFNAVVWPAGAQPLTSNAEIVRVTAISTDTFTIVRAQEGSSARSIGVGDQIAQNLTAKTITDLELPTLDVIAANHPPAADWSNNSHKITSLADGVANTDAATARQAIRSPLRPSAALYETFPRAWFGGGTNGFTTSQQVGLVSIVLPSGVTISSISFMSGTTALAGGVNQVFGIYDNNLNLLATTADDGSTAWAANTVKTLNLSPSSFTTTYSGQHYLAILINASTVPNLQTTVAISTLLALTPVLNGVSTGSRTSLPATASTPTVRNIVPYAYVS